MSFYCYRPNKHEAGCTCKITSIRIAEVHHVWLNDAHTLQGYLMASERGVSIQLCPKGDGPNDPDFVVA